MKNKFSFDIIPFLDNLGKEYKVIGDELLMACPVCGREHHFYYNRIKHLCICQRCKWEGNLVSFLIVGLGLAKKEALRIVYGRVDRSIFGIKARVRKLMPMDEESLEIYSVYFRNKIPDGTIIVTKDKYPLALAERGVSYNIARLLGVGYCNSSGIYNNRLIFPIHTLKNETFCAPTAIIKKKYTKFKEDQKKRGIEFRKNLFPRGSVMSEMLYLYNEWARHKNECIVVTEGIWDALKVITSLRVPATCTFGDKISNKQALLLSSLDVKKIYIMLDGDVPSERKIKYCKMVESICFDKEVKVSFLPVDKDPDDLGTIDLEKIIKEKSFSWKTAEILRKTNSL